MHFSVQLFTWTLRQGVHQVGSTIEIDAIDPKVAVTSLLGLRLDDAGSCEKLAARVWSATDDVSALCSCYYYH